MNDPGTSVEHMDRLYLWRASKASRRVHIENRETLRTFCQVENCGGKPLDGKGAEIPVGRRICGNCNDLASRNEADYREPDVRVLMGERIAETEPELFADIEAPKPERADFTSPGRGKWKRKRQVQPANRPKGRRPKRSNVKYPRPFDDDLPW